MFYPNPSFILESSCMTCCLRVEGSGQDAAAALDIRVISESGQEQGSINKALELMNEASSSPVDAVIRKPDVQHQTIHAAIVCGGIRRILDKREKNSAICRVDCGGTGHVQLRYGNNFLRTISHVDWMKAALRYM